MVVLRSICGADLAARDCVAQKDCEHSVRRQVVFALVERQDNQRAALVEVRVGQ